MCTPESVIFNNIYNFIVSVSFASHSLRRGAEDSTHIAFLVFTLLFVAVVVVVVLTLRVHLFQYLFWVVSCLVTTGI